MLLSQRNSKTKLSQQKKLRYSPETELINNFDKSHDSVLIAKIQHFVSITNINNESQIDCCYGLMKNIFQELFQTWNPFHNVMALWSHHSIIFPFTQQKRERKLLMSIKQNENLNQKHISFLHEQNHKEKLQQNNFSNYFTFSPTEINRTPRSLL